MFPCADRSDRTLLVSGAGLEQAKSLISMYKQNKIPTMTPELWKAKKVVDSTLHPGMAILGGGSGSGSEDKKDCS